LAKALPVGLRRSIELLPQEVIIAKNRISFAKRAREVDKKRKQEEKRARRKDPSLKPIRQDDKPEDDSAGDDSSDNTNP
jgi:hypothetical protein